MVFLFFQNHCGLSQWRVEDCQGSGIYCILTVLFKLTRFCLSRIFLQDRICLDKLFYNVFLKIVIRRRIFSQRDVLIRRGDTLHLWNKCRLVFCHREKTCLWLIRGTCLWWCWHGWSCFLKELQLQSSLRLWSSHRIQADRSQNRVLLLTKKSLNTLLCSPTQSTDIQRSLIFLKTSFCSSILLWQTGMSKKKGGDSLILRMVMCVWEKSSVWRAGSLWDRWK